MKKGPNRPTKPTIARQLGVADLRAEYDFRGGVRGKYTKRVPHGTYLILLDPDLAAHFRSEAEVNQALRQYLRERGK